MKLPEFIPLNYNTDLGISGVESTTRMAVPHTDTGVKTNIFDYTYDALNRLENATIC